MENIIFELLNEFKNIIQESFQNLILVTGLSNKQLFLALVILVVISIVVNKK